jgi:hypothetical protein
MRNNAAFKATLTKLSSLSQNGKYPAPSRGLQFCKINSRGLVDSRKRFSALETMCRERAQLAKREFEYWLAEADEWARYKESSDPSIEAPNSTGVRNLGATSKIHQQT